MAAVAKVEPIQRQEPETRSFFQVSQVVQGPKDLDHSPLFFQATHRELNEEWSSPDMNQHPSEVRVPGGGD